MTTLAHTKQAEPKFLDITTNLGFTQHMRQCVKENRLGLAKVCLFGSVTGLLGRRLPGRVMSALTNHHGISETTKNKTLNAYVVTKTTEKEVRGFLNKVVFQRQQTLTFINNPDFSTLPIHFSFTKGDKILVVDIGSPDLLEWIREHVDDADHLLSLARYKEVQAYVHSNLCLSIFGIPKVNQTYKPREFDNQWLKTMRL